MFSLYLHIPFCVHRCAYCDFNTYAGLSELIPAYMSALNREVEQVHEAAGERLPVHTIFFGGGTPSLIQAEFLEILFQAIQDNFSLQPGCEITLEVNPGTLTANYFINLQRMGVNRISLGVQSTNPGELRLLERQHDTADVIRAVQSVRRAGIRNLNLDLIYGLPYQDMAAWQRTLQLASNLAPEHFSLYALTLEHGTPMHGWVKRGLMAEPDGDLAADMYEWASDFLDACGYRQYEISNWARPGGDGDLLACRHNLQYWRGLPYIGLGAGAHGYAAGVRTANVLSPQAYIQRLEQGSPGKFPHTSATVQAQELTKEDEMGEFMMMGLRLVGEGVSNSAFQERFGMNLQQAYSHRIEKLVKQGLLDWDGSQLRLTKTARLLGNRVFVEFI